MEGDSVSANAGGDGSQAASDVGIHRVEPADWSALRQARLAAMVDAPEAFGSTAARELALVEAEWRRRIATAAWFLAWADEPGADPLGVVATGPLETEATAAARRDWGLWSMWVSPASRGTGVADGLVAAAASHARAAGGARLVLWVADGNVRARTFYLRIGFRPTGAHQRFERDDGTMLEEEEMAMELPAVR